MAPKRKASPMDGPFRRSKRIKSSKPFVYQPLLPGTIRVLILEPGAREDTLYGSLEIVSIDDSPQYEAISYAWGEPVFPHRLYLPEGYLRITTSLFGALRRFRRTDSAVQLWADQVSIDQQSVHEKNHQVEIMAEIFREAERVLVWLGEEQGSDSLASWTLQLLAEYQRDLRLIDRYFLPHDVDGMHRETSKRTIRLYNVLQSSDMALTGRHRNTNLATALHTVSQSLWSRPWFSRLWVVQEIAVAKTAVIYYGTQTLEWTHMYDASYGYWRCSEDFDVGLNISGRERSLLERSILLFDHINSFRSTSDYDRLLDCLLFTLDLSAKEAHDRVFAIRALAHVQDIEELRPDYNVSLSELWMKTTIFILTSRSRWYDEPRLSCAPPTLVFALGGTQKSRNIPSWAPDLSKMTSESMRKYFWYVENARGVWAGGKSRTELFWSSLTPDIIQLRAVIASRIVETCPGSECKPINSFAQRSQTVETHLDLVRTRVIPWYMSCRRFVASCARRRAVELSEFGSLLRHGSYFCEQSGPTYDQFYIAALNMEDSPFRTTCNRQLLAEMFEHLNPFMRWYRQDLDIDRSRILALTDRGRHGWIPNGCRIGDIVCLFQGAPCPFIIRERPDGYYTLLGDAYIQGIMHGEAWPNDIEETIMIGLK